MTVRRIREILRQGEPGQRTVAEGWLRSVRHSKEVAFLDLVDGSALAGLQVVLDGDLAREVGQGGGLSTGAAVRASGTLVESPGGRQRIELRAEALELVGPVAADYPLQKKRHSFEFLRTIGHLRLRTNTLGAVARLRNEAAQAIHRFFQERGFVELHTPVVTLADAEGAGEMFRVTTLDAADPPRRDGACDFTQDFFGEEAHLTVSGQLEAEIGALALRDVYSFGPTFRAENSNTSRHLAEFWMVEPEMAFCDLEGDVAVAEAFLRSVFGRLLERCPEDLQLFEDRIQKGVIDTLRHVAEQPFERLSYGEAIRALERSGRAFEYPPRWGADLQSEHERFLAEEHVGRPLVVTDYPAELKAFYMYRNDDGRTVRAMDVLVPRIGEIIGGSQREHREDVLLERMRDQGLDPGAYWWYLELRRFGGVPHAGFGVGFERLVQFATGMANIRDVIPFPRVPGWAAF